MKVHNKTDWDTRSLRSFFLKGLKAKGVSPRGYNIHVSYTKMKRKPIGDCECWTDKHGNAMHGYAYFHHPTIHMFMPREIFDIAQFARVFDHEVDHTRNLRHKDMIDDDLRDVSWSDGLTIAKKTVKTKPKTDIVQKRASHAQKKRSEWQKKLKQAKAHFQKWDKKVDYYERHYPHRI